MSERGRRWSLAAASHRHRRRRRRRVDEVLDVGVIVAVGAAAAAVLLCAGLDEVSRPRTSYAAAAVPAAAVDVDNGLHGGQRLRSPGA